MITRYALREIFLFGLAGLAAALLLPGGFWLWTAIAFAAYIALTLASSVAFRIGVHAGLISRAKEKVSAFFVHPACPMLWLVRRHIRATPPTLLRAPISKSKRQTVV